MLTGLEFEPINTRHDGADVYKKDGRWVYSVSGNYGDHRDAWLVEPISGEGWTVTLMAHGPNYEWDEPLIIGRGENLDYDGAELVAYAFISSGERWFGFHRGVPVLDFSRNLDLGYVETIHRYDIHRTSELFSQDGQCFAHLETYHWAEDFAAYQQDHRARRRFPEHGLLPRDEVKAAALDWVIAHERTDAREL